MELGKIIGDLVQLCQEQQVLLSIDITSEGGGHYVKITYALGKKRLRKIYYIAGGVLNRNNYAFHTEMEINNTFMKDIQELKNAVMAKGGK